MAMQHAAVRASELPGAPNVSRSLMLLTDSHPESLKRARRQIRQAAQIAGLPADDVNDLETAAGEVLSNTYRHAYRSQPGPVFVEVFRTRRLVAVVVIDHGVAEKAPTLPDAPPSTDKHDGRGLYLVARLTDEQRICVGSGGHGLVVLILKWLPGKHPNPPIRGARAAEPVGTALVLDVRRTGVIRKTERVIAVTRQVISETQALVETARIQRLEHRMAGQPTA